DQETARRGDFRLAKENIVRIDADTAAGLGIAGDENLLAVDLDGFDEDFRRALAGGRAAGIRLRHGGDVLFAGSLFACRISRLLGGGRRCVFATRGLCRSAAAAVCLTCRLIALPTGGSALPRLRPGRLWAAGFLRRSLAACRRRLLAGGRCC